MHYQYTDMCLPLQALLLFVSLQSSWAYSCPSTPVTIKYQGQPYSFPAQGADDHYAPNQNCTWIVQVPDGYYITYGFVASIQDANLNAIELRGSQKNYIVWSENQYDVIEDIMCDQLTINLNSQQVATGYFHFNITWNKKEPAAKPTVVKVADLGYQLFDMRKMALHNTVSFQAKGSGQLFLSIDDHVSPDPSLVLVYDGPAVVPGADYFTCYDPMTSDVKNGVKSTTGSLTMYSPKNDTDVRISAIVTDLRVVEQFDYYNGMVVHSFTSEYAIVSANANEKAAFSYFTSANQPLSVYNISFQLGNEPLLAYDGVPADISAVAPLATLTSDTSLPYNFAVPVVTFVVAPVKDSVQFAISAGPVQTTLNDIRTILHKTEVRRVTKVKKSNRGQTTATEHGESQRIVRAMRKN